MVSDDCKVKIDSFLAAPLTAYADDNLADALSSNDDSGQSMVELSGGIGVVFLKANEILFDRPSSSNHRSQLIWQSTTPVLTGSATVTLPEGCNCRWGCLNTAALPLLFSI